MITATFTDPQGMSHTDAVLYIKSANYIRRVNESLYRNNSDYDNVLNPSAEDTTNISYSADYWLNASAKASGAAPYALTDTSDADNTFTFTPDATYDGLSLEAKCEKHLNDVVLPPLQV